MNNIMSRSHFSRSPRRHSSNQDPAITRSQSHHTAPASRLSPPPPPTNARRSSLSAELRGMRRLEQRRNMEESHYLNCKARAQNYNPPVDLRMLDYVSPYDSNLMCPICRCPFVDPVVLAECDHCFCRDCIRQSWNSHPNYTPLGPRGDCPTCRAPAKLGPRSATSKILVNIVDELVVKCPKSDDGCKAQVRRGEVQDHVNIYCGHALIECVGDDCELPVRRRDASQGCLHYGVSCLSCRKELQKWKLEIHWRSECPDREVHCDLCKSSVFYRDLEEHSKNSCPAISTPCPGQAFGCTSRNKRGQAEIHARSCVFAKLAPMLQRQQERLDEQEAAQREMSRKLEVLESGFASIRGILYPSPKDEQQEPQPPPTTTDDPPPPPIPFLPLPEGAGEEEEGLYTSPLHHLLSMHESLRDETTRISACLAELDGRHSLQILNENLRTRDELSYLGAQVAGLARQVGWLTSGQLQQRQTTTRVVGGREGAQAQAQAQVMRRRESEEGSRTKL